MGVMIICEGKKMKCNECNKKCLSLHHIYQGGFDEDLCDECWEAKGGWDYEAALRELLGEIT